MSAEQLAPVASSINQFGFSLFSRMSLNQNAMVSPYDIARALALLELASAGETQSEIDRALGFTDASRAIAALPSLEQAIERSAERPGFALAGAARVWPSRSLPVLESYRESVSQFLGAPLVSLDYQRDPEAQRRTINEWVSRQTRGRIAELLAPGMVTERTRIVLTTALYFLGRWSNVFSASQTRPRDFFVSERQTKLVPMMHKAMWARAMQDGDVRMLELDYEGGELAMNVVLPSQGRTLSAVHAQLNQANFSRWVSALRARYVRVEMPRFTLTTRASLGELLEQMGVRSVFGPSANLQRLATSGPLWVDAATHQVFVEVNERGTEAAAATALLVQGTAKPPEPWVFSVNQPFIFAICHKPTGTILFLGNVVDPAPNT
jgi:serpin B